jgi:hypothetical protein
MASRVSVSLLNKVDLPTFGLPTIAAILDIFFELKVSKVFKVHKVLLSTLQTFDFINSL